MLARVKSGALMGVDAYLVEVEVDLAPGLPAFTTVGLPEAAVKESKDRVKAALKNSGYQFPNNRITLNLAPADVRKEGTGFDLPAALGILCAQGVVPQEALESYLVFGELSLDGRLKPTRGCCPWAWSPGTRASPSSSPRTTPGRPGWCRGSAPLPRKTWPRWWNS